MIDIRVNNGGHNIKLTEEVEEVIQEFYTYIRGSLKREVQSHLTQELGVNIGITTLKKAKNNLGFIGTKPKVIRDIAPANIEKILNYCTLHKNDKFSNCLFTDESSIQLFENKSLVWWQPADEQRPQIVVKENKQKVMIWEGIAMKTKIDLQIIRTDEGETMDSDIYLLTLKGYAIEPQNEVYGYGRWRIMHDNARPHKANLIKDFLSQNDIKEIDHPSYSPDLNPIEKVWSIIKSNLYSCSYKNINTLIEFLHTEWAKIDQQLIIKLIQNHQETIQNVREANGNYV